MAAIYIVEDEENIRNLISYALNNSGYDALGFGDGASLFTQIDQEKPSLIILDIMLDGEDGYEILKQIRSTKNIEDIPIIMLTAKDQEYDKVKALDMGADDYITKPFGVMEMISRVKAVLRRIPSREENVEEANVEFKDIILDLNKRTVEIDGEFVDMTFKEFELLYYLIKNRNIVLTRDQITNEIWGYDYEGESRTVDVHIRSLRQKLTDDRKYIKTVRNVGYMIED